MKKKTVDVFYETEALKLANKYDMKFDYLRDQMMSS